MFTRYQRMVKMIIKPYLVTPLKWIQWSPFIRYIIEAILLIIITMNHVLLLLVFRPGFMLETIFRNSTFKWVIEMSFIAVRLLLETADVGPTVLCGMLMLSKIGGSSSEGLGPKFGVSPKLINPCLAFTLNTPYKNRLSTVTSYTLFSKILNLLNS